MLNDFSMIVKNGTHLLTSAYSSAHKFRKRGEATVWRKIYNSPKQCRSNGPNKIIAALPERNSGKQKGGLQKNLQEKQNLRPTKEWGFKTEPEIKLQEQHSHNDG